MPWLITENPIIDWCNKKVLFKSNRTKQVFAPQSEQVSKVQDCHFINDYNGETKLVSAPQSEQVSKVQAFHIMNESNGETKRVSLHRKSKRQESRNVISLMTIMVRRESWCYRIAAILIYWIRLTIVLRVFLVFIRWRIQWYRLL